jgi:hypothetical protein
LSKTREYWRWLNRADLNTDFKTKYGHISEAVVFSMDACVTLVFARAVPGLAFLRHYGDNLMEKWISGESCPRV